VKRIWKSLLLLTLIVAPATMSITQTRFGGDPPPNCDPADPTCGKPPAQ